MNNKFNLKIISFHKPEAFLNRNFLDEKLNTNN